jgi:HAD superfamily hydrolase (TIGR01549 family)
LFPEVPEVLARVRAAGLRIAVCSNLACEYGPAVRRLLLGLDAYLLSFEVGAVKPSPEMYAATCTALGCAPGEVMFIGDSRRCDLMGPLGFGLQARWLDRSAGKTLIDAIEGIA